MAVGFHVFEADDAGTLLGLEVFHQFHFGFELARFEVGDGLLVLRLLVRVFRKLVIGLVDTLFFVSFTIVCCDSFFCFIDLSCSARRAVRHSL